MWESLRRRSQTAFTQNVVKVMGGTMVAQAFGIAIAPILTRLYSPAAFGAFGLFLGITAIGSTVVCARYEMAIVLPRSDGDAAGLLWAAMTIAVASSVATLLVLAALAPVIVGRWTLQEPVLWLVLLPGALLAMGTFASANAWSQRKKDFGQIAAVRAIQAGATGSTQVAMGLGGFGAIGLVSGYAFGYVVGSARLLVRIWKTDKEPIIQAASPTTVRKQACTYADFPKYAMPTGIINSASHQVPTFLFPLFFPLGVLGHYVLAYRVFSLPLSVIGQAFTKVFFQRAAEQYSQGRDLRRLIVKSYVYLLAIATVPAAVLAISAPWLFSTVFGSEWRLAGIYCQLLIPFVAAKFVVSPSTAVFAILGKQRHLLFYESATVVLRVSAVLTGGLVFGSAFAAISIYSLVGVAVYVFYCVKVLALCAQPRHDPRSSRISSIP
jgi:lipopolysaccharide exporter